ncbi:DUF998 domain-containing protein [Stakelama tenebrarum]|nr:DUF998 domain-containing protein [Sphingosinithalassobacter tenebrarum]
MAGDRDVTRNERLSRVGGIVALLGCVLVLAADLLGVTLASRIGPVSETISNVAAGPYDWIEDAGLYAFVIAVLAVAAGLSFWRVDGWDWVVGQGLLVLLAADVIAIAAYEAYNRPGGGPDLHLYFVGVLGASFPLAVWLTSRGLTAGSRRKWWLRGFAAVWGLAAPFLYVMPTGWDGLYERVLALCMLGWFALVGYHLWRHAECGRLGGGRIA